MERLTETIYKKGYCNGKTACEDNCEDCNHFETMVDRLAYYEDLEEQGLLLVLPCKVGDTVYSIEVFEIKEFVVTEFEITKSRIVAWQGHTYVGDMGISVFATKEEAEQKLASMQKGE